MAPIPLVSTDWLAERLGEPSLKVIDASFKMPGVTPTAHVDYEAAHIRGAVFFDHDDIADPASRPPHMLPSAPLFAEKVEALGLGDADLIVAYDSSGLGATRAWWAFRAFGHDAIAVLDGGLTKWRQEGRAVTQAQIHPAPTAFTPHFRPHLVRSVADMLANARTFVEQVIDARSAGRFEGRDPEPRPGLRSGHIPGSRNLDWQQLLDPTDRTFKPMTELRKLIEDAGIDLSLALVASCGSGISAAVIAFAAYLVGKTDVAIYDGSWAEWGVDPALPIETGTDGGD